LGVFLIVICFAYAPFVLHQVCALILIWLIQLLLSNFVLWPGVARRPITFLLRQKR